MTPGLARAFRRLAAGALLLAYPLLAHYAMLAGAAGLAAAVAVLPLAAIAFGAAWRSPRRLSMLALCGAASAALAGFWGPLREHAGWLYFIQHAGANAALGLLFGRTLRAGRQALCSRLSAMAHGPLSPGRARYSRQVTVAWTVYFALVAGVSALLFFLAPIAAWSAFANLLAPSLAVLLFVAEHAVRRRVLPLEKHAGWLAAARTFWNLPPAAAGRPARGSGQW